MKHSCSTPLNSSTHHRLFVYAIFSVGYSEDEALEKFGKDNVEVYHKSFVPLEWSISESRSHHEGFTKVIVDKDSDKVLGIHFLGPAAGEVMQVSVISAP